MNKKKFRQITELTAIEFDPKEHPYHRSIQRHTIDGKIPDDYEAYFCIIPFDGFETIKPGDWIIVDDMENAKGVIPKNMMKMMHVEPIEEESCIFVNGPCVNPTQRFDCASCDKISKEQKIFK